MVNVNAIDGSLVVTLVNEVMSAGQRQVTWAGRDSSGNQNLSKTGITKSCSKVNYLGSPM